MAYQGDALPLPYSAVIHACAELAHRYPYIGLSFGAEEDEIPESESCVFPLVRLDLHPSHCPNVVLAQVVYSVKELPPAAGYVQSEATAINERGDVVGNSHPPTINWNGMATRWVAGRPSALGINKAAREFQYSTARSINRTGLVVGESDDGRPNAVVFNKSGGTFLTKGANNSYALFANDTGLIYGYMLKALTEHSCQSSGRQFLKRQPITYTELKFIDSTGAYGEANMTAANNVGQSVGYGIDSQLGQVPVIWEAGAVLGTPLPADPYVAVDPIGLNDMGMVVGQTGTSDGHTHPIIWNIKPSYEVIHLPLFEGEVSGGAIGINNHNIVIGHHHDLPAVWIDGQIQDINSSLNSSGTGWLIERINDINDSGVMVGSGLKNGVRRAVMLTPMP